MIVIILLIILLINAIVSVVYFLINRFTGDKKNGLRNSAWIRLFIMLFIPVIGPIFFFMSWVMYKIFYSSPVDLEDVIFSKDRIKFNLKADEDKERNLVSMEEENPYEKYKMIQNELKSYGMGLDKRPLVVVASKMDSEESEAKFDEFKKHFKGKVYSLSSIMNIGIEEILNKCVELLAKTDKFPLVTEDEKSDIRVYNAYESSKPIFEIKHEKDHVFRIVGESIERTYSLINISTDEGLMKLISYLQKIEVEKALKEKGAVDGDTVILCDFEFEYLE